MGYNVGLIESVLDLGSGVRQGVVETLCALAKVLNDLRALDARCRDLLMREELGLPKARRERKPRPPAAATE